MPISSGRAQDAVAEPFKIEPSGAAYLKSIRLRRINSDVAYFDPSSPPPPLDTRQEPEKPPDRDGNTNATLKAPSALIAAAVLLIVGFVFVKYGGGITVSLGRDRNNPNRGKRTLSDDTTETVPRALDSILKLADRRVALVLLAQRALASAVAANGILLQSSWTARDALRRLPGDQGHLDDLRALVFASERVQFGGRDVTEDEFRDHLQSIRPLLGSDAI